MSNKTVKSTKAKRAKMQSKTAKGWGLLRTNGTLVEVSDYYLIPWLSPSRSKVLKIKASDERCLLITATYTYTCPRRKGSK